MATMPLRFASWLCPLALVVSAGCGATGGHASEISAPAASPTPAVVVESEPQPDGGAEGVPEGVGSADMQAKPRAFTRCKEGAPSPSPVGEIRDIDWCNFEYAPGWLALRGGVEEMHEYAEMGGMHDTYIWKLEAVAYGDLGGPAGEEAVVLISEESWYAGGTGSVGAMLYLFRLEAGLPVQVATTPASWDEQLSLELRGGSIVEVAEGEARRCSVVWRPFASKSEPERECVEKQP